MTEITDEFRRSILRKEFYMDVLNCDPMSFDKECELTNAHFHKSTVDVSSERPHYVALFPPLALPNFFSTIKLSDCLLFF